jgi:hypothetical protein
MMRHSVILNDTMTDDKSGIGSFRVLFGEKFVILSSVICHSVLAG